MLEVGPFQHLVRSLTVIEIKKSVIFMRLRILN